MKCDLCGEYDPGAITHEWFFGKELASHAVGSPYQTLGGLQQVVSKTYGDFRHAAATLCPKCRAQRKRRKMGEGLLLLLGGLACAAATIALLGEDSVGGLAKFLVSAFGLLLIFAAAATFRGGEDMLFQPVAHAKLGEGAWLCWSPEEFAALSSNSDMQRVKQPRGMAGHATSDSTRADSISAPQGRKCVSCGRPILGEGQYCVWCGQGSTAPIRGI